MVHILNLNKQKQQKQLLICSNQLCSEDILCVFGNYRQFLLNKYNQFNTMNTIDEKSLVLIKFQPEEVLFMDKNSRIRYRYFESKDICLLPTIQHPHLLRAISFKKGVVFQKQQSNLELEIAHRSRAHEKNIFSEEEIVNTFQPLFKCLEYLHSQGITHGSIHPQNIVIIDQDIKLRGWFLPSPVNTNQQQQRKTYKDVQALGLCLLNCLTLSVAPLSKSQSQSQLLLVVQRYSKNFSIIVIIIVKQLQDYYSQIASILSGENKSIDKKLTDFYEQIKGTNLKAKKKGGMNVGLPIQFSPAKKFVISNGNRRVIHYENIQNKLEVEGRIEKNTKMLERGKLAQELINKKINQQQRRMKEQSLKRVYTRTPILNLSNYGIENTSKKAPWEHTSPAHKNKNISHKK